MTESPLPAPALPGSGLRPQRWGIWDAVITIALAFVLAFVTGLILIAIDAPLWAMLIFGTAAPWVAFIGWPWFATTRRGNGPVIDLRLRLTWRELGWGIVGGIAALIIGSIVAWLTSLLLGEFDAAAAEAANELRTAGPTWALLVFTLMIAFGAPFAEEFAFRGMLYSSLAKKGLNAFWSIGISALAFGLFHFELTRLVVLVVIGCVLGIVRWRTDSLGASMVAHAVNNLPGAILILFAS